MLEGLFGNKNVEKILIFLFVNGKCYGTQLHRSLKTSLTPIQKALIRLEKGGIITSYHEGKTRLYQFNLAYPLINELEALLKRSYHLLPAIKKREYYVRKEELGLEIDQESKMQILLHFWEKLTKVSQLIFHAKTKSKDENGWNGRGQGEVGVVKEGNHSLIFQEKGFWKTEKGEEVTFSNVFRWVLDCRKGVISLEHLRRGPDHPVFLFYLVPCGPDSLCSIESHLCEEDTYFGQIHFDRHRFRLNWRVIGPKKNEEIDYYYS
jgi:hypothetical protein